MNVFEAVRKFWEIGHPDKIGEEPAFPAQEVQDLNLRLIREEFDELQLASEDDDLVEVADALADLIYVAVGMGITHGIPLEKVFAEVQRTNMAKYPGGVVTRRPSDGKVVKPEGWEPPLIGPILNEAKKCVVCDARRTGMGVTCGSKACLSEKYGEERP